MELSDDTLSVYLEVLLTLTPAQLREATRRTIQEWAEPSKMPPPKFITDRAPTPQILGRKFATVADVDPEKFPKDWTPEEVFRAHLTQEKIRGTARRPLPFDGDPVTLDELRLEARKFNPAQVRDWLDAGKEAQNEYIAKLEATPEWQIQARRFGVPLRPEA